MENKSYARQIHLRSDNPLVKAEPLLSTRLRILYACGVLVAPIVAWYYVGFWPALVLALLGWIVIPVICGYVKSVKTDRKLQEIAGRIKVILDRGYATSKEEFLLIFPEACPSCCSRDFIVQSIYVGDKGHLPDDPAMPEYDQTATCKRCGYLEKTGKSGGSSPLETSGLYATRVSSPFIWDKYGSSPELHDNFQDFDPRKSD